MDIIQSLIRFWLKKLEKPLKIRLTLEISLFCLCYHIQFFILNIMTRKLNTAFLIYINYDSKESLNNCWLLINLLKKISFDKQLIGIWISVVPYGYLIQQKDKRVHFSIKIVSPQSWKCLVIYSWQLPTEQSESFRARICV